MRAVIQNAFHWARRETGNPPKLSSRSLDEVCHALRQVTENKEALAHLLCWLGFLST